jgi:enterochelin esterase-like enzyme
MRRSLVTAMLLALVMVPVFSQAIAEQNEPVDFTKYARGVTVEEDCSSPTGYTATFIYEEEDTDTYLVKNQPVTIGEIAKVELYSDCMLLFTGTEGTTVAYNPDEFVAGMSPAGGSGDTTYYAEMTEFADGLWGVQVPLTSGAFVYNFQLTDTDGNVVSRQDDPNNPTMVNSETGITSLSSMVYVPYNREKMGVGLYADRTIENPCDEAGTVETISYTGAAGDTRGLAVYLPYGYDENREEPYKVLYISHGASGDSVGNEMRWLNEGCVANITDNLVKEGKVEPFVVVAMNNQDLGWDFSRIETEQFDYIMPLIEERYNVATTAEGRAFAGLSMGGITTSRMFMNHASEFSYFGVWSAADTSVADHLEYLSSLENMPKVMVGGGDWDFGLSSSLTFGKMLYKYFDLDVVFLSVPGAHDWETWQLLYAYAAENFFWK